MDIDRARTFLEIVQTGSFRDAADRLHVTQTTVSARIRTLEDELGRTLFVRNRNGAQLTAAGREFQPYAQSMVQLWERARHQLAIPAGRSSIVALGGELSLWNPLLLDWLVWMRKALPHVAIQAQVGVPDQLLAQLRTGILDISALFVRTSLSRFSVKLVHEEQLVLVRLPSCPIHDEQAYVQVDWGPQFAARHEEGVRGFGEPGLMV